MGRSLQMVAQAPGYQAHKTEKAQCHQSKESSFASPLQALRRRIVIVASELLPLTRFDSILLNLEAGLTPVFP